MLHLTYRRELDGIRAIAVISVVLFHVGYPDMSGGYTGVDVFFVLSGYLICGQTYTLLEQGRYSVTDFFARRIRRLSTAYFVCFFVTGLVAYNLFLQSELESLFRNLLGSVTFTNNFNLLNNQGYFNTGADENPFLHTWSLSIEEQFYIALPLLILLTRRSLAAFRRILVVVFVGSLLLTLFSGDLIHNKDERYFSSLFRVWELATGGLIFVVMRRFPQIVMPAIAPWLGLVLIVVPVVTLDPTYLYPGWPALAPVMGAALIIWSAIPENSWIGRCLGNRVMTYIGRISYGTYIWQWPLIVFVQYVGVELNDVLRALLLFGSLALGALSHHLVENPVRRWDIATHKSRLYLMFVIQTAILLALTAFVYVKAQNVNKDENQYVAVIKAASQVYHPDWDRCWSQTSPEEFCQVGDTGKFRPDFLVWGDSMANSALYSFDAFARETGRSGYIAPQPACAPLVDVVRDNSGAEDCREVNQAILRYLDDAPPMDVILFARWSYYSEGYSNIGLDNTNPVELLDAEGARLGPRSYSAFLEAYEKTLARLSRRHRVIVIGQIPEFPYFVPKAMLKSLRFGNSPSPKTLEMLEADSGRTMRDMRRITAEAGVQLIEPHLDFCPGAECLYQIDGDPLFADHVHLSKRGNQLLSDILLRELR